MAEDLPTNSAQKNTQSEQELQLKKRARRRLVGAIALVLAMVVILPMILDDKSTKPQAPITISIPDEDNTEFTSNIVPLPPVDAIPERVEPATTVDAPTANTTPESTPVIEKTEIVPIKTEQATVEPTKPEVVKPQPLTTETKVEKPATSNTGKFAVQIGVFSNAEAVKELQVKLLADGIKTHTNNIKTDKGDKIRLKTSPFDTREAATEALSTIKSAGVAGMIVAE